MHSPKVISLLQVVLLICAGIHCLLDQQGLTLGTLDQPTAPAKQHDSSDHSGCICKGAICDQQVVSVPGVDQLSLQTSLAKTIPSGTRLPLLGPSSFPTPASACHDASRRRIELQSLLL